MEQFQQQPGQSGTITIQRSLPPPPPQQAKITVSRNAPPPEKHTEVSISRTIQHVPQPEVITRTVQKPQEVIVQEKVIEVPKKVVKEKFVEVPEIEYVEKIVEVPQVVVEDRVKRVPKIEYEDRVIKVPKTVYVDKIIEVPEIEYRTIPVEKIVEVPEVREEVVVKEIEVPPVVEVPVPEYVQVTDEEEVHRRIPVGVEVTATYEYKLPRVIGKYKEQHMTVQVPRFIEIPVPEQMMDEETIRNSQELYERITRLSARGSISLSEFQNLENDSTRYTRNFKFPAGYNRPIMGKSNGKRTDKPLVAGA